MKAGRIIAGPLVRLACARHLKDRRRRDLVFSEAKADHAIIFFENFLRLPDAHDDHDNPRPFLLSPHQAFIIGSLFGWLLPTGVRRFRTGYIEVGKGDGKTPLCAGIGLYGLVMDGELAPEIYAAAVDRAQAAIMFRDAERIMDASPDLAKRLKRTPAGEAKGVGNISYAANLGFFRPFSRDQGIRSGPRPHMFLLDELHEQRTAEIVNKGRAGAKRRKQPLFVEITNAGFDRTSVCWQHHEHSKRVLEGTVKDDRWFAYVCALDEGDDPLKDPGCWVKANPNIGVTVTKEYLTERVQAAKNIPAETNTVLRLNFCVWTTTHSRFVDMAKWHACAGNVSDAELVGVRCYAGLDLGQSDDLSAFVRAWFLDDGRVAVKTRIWIPQAALEGYPNRPYAEWLRAGVIEITEGDITDYDQVEDAVRGDCLADGVIECAYDKRFAQQMALHLEGAGITMVDTPQGFQLNEALRKLSDLITDGDLRHGGHPVLGYAASNTVVRHGRQGEIRPDKEKAADKIDPIVALTMAVARWIANSKGPGESAYSDGHGLMFVGS